MTYNLQAVMSLQIFVLRVQFRPQHSFVCEDHN